MCAAQHDDIHSVPLHMHSYSEVSCSLFSITGADDKILFSKVRVYSDGNVEWWRIGQFSSTCEINVAMYPFDEQTCTMEFIAWYEDNDVILSVTQFEDDDENADGDSNSKQEVSEPRFEGEWKVVGKSCIFFSYIALRIWPVIRGYCCAFSRSITYLFSCLRGSDHKTQQQKIRKIEAGFAVGSGWYRYVHSWRVQVCTFLIKRDQRLTIEYGTNRTTASLHQ